jgi:LPS sulfotransferase NodH
MGATPNGIYGLKVFPSQHDVVAPTCAWTSLLPNLKFLWLQRRDLLGQAISATRVVQTGQFRATVPATAAPEYDAHLIRQHLATTVRDQARWALFFARTAISPLPVFYEDVVADPQTVVDRIAAFIDVKQRAVIRSEVIELNIQRDALTEEWRARFLQEEGGRDVIDQF